MTALISLAESELAPFNQALEQRSAMEIIRWTLDVFPQTAMLTSGQKAGSVLAKILYRMGLQIDMAFVDTGVLFTETLETVAQMSHAYGLPLKTYRPQQTMEEQTRQYGVLYLTHPGQEKCCELRKVEPLQGIHQTYQALLGPLRRGEGGSRAKVPIVSLDPSLQVVRINPMANLAEADYERYVGEADTIINPLHAQGYPTIGCNRCTTPVREDEAERAGRWRHLSGVEYCGINPSDFFRKTATIQLPAEIVSRLHDSLNALEALHA